MARGGQGNTGENERPATHAARELRYACAQVCYGIVFALWTRVPPGSMYTFAGVYEMSFARPAPHVTHTVLT